MYPGLEIVFNLAELDKSPLTILDEPGPELAGCVDKKRGLKSLLLFKPSVHLPCSIIVHIVLDNIPGNGINRIVVLCSAGIEFNFIFRSTVIILQLCFCKLYI